MKLISSILITLLILSAAFAQEDDTLIEAPALTFVVNSNGDTNDINTADNICADASGNCTLRAAIQQANISAGVDTITFALANPATINLTLSQLSITSSITIIGTGARNLIVQRSTVAGTANFRIFNISVASGTIVNISGITITNGNNGNESFGGGIQNTSSGDTLNLADVTVTNNTSSFVGGGIYTTSTLNITRSTISFNRTVGGMGLDAGGIAINIGGVVNISNSTISNNQAAAGGGGIFVFGQLTLNNVTISNNTATQGGGVSVGAGGSASVRNTIIAANTAPTSPDVIGVFTSRGNNLIGNGTGGSGFTNGVNGDQVGTGATPINPMLGPLQNNGGQTDTRALLTGSRAIDAGNNCVVTATCPLANPINALTTDQRGTGFPRQTGSNVDIGAFEVSSTGPGGALNLLDFNGDRRADLAVARPTNNSVFTVFIQRTDGSASAVQFGVVGDDTFTPGDYDGDGRTDLAVFRNSTGVFFVQRSSDNTVSGFQFGAPRDEPVARDFDGDGRTDFAVVRRSGVTGTSNGTLTWFIRNSSDGSFRTVQFGFATDVVAPGDYDGDGRFDIAVFRGTGDQPATFFVLRSSGGFVATQFGIGSDRVVPGDYDGDGRTDYAVVRTGTVYNWYILRSSNTTLLTVQLGTKPHLTVQNDYDGDGRTDVAVWNPQNGYYYFARSATNFTVVAAVPFGQNGDYPIANYNTF